MLVNYVNATLEGTVRDTTDLFRVIDLIPLEQARVPHTPDSPQPSRDIPAGAGLGLALGIVLALITRLYARIAARPARQRGP